mgnify:CR=1 FL=1
MQLDNESVLDTETNNKTFQEVKQTKLIHRKLKSKLTNTLTMGEEELLVSEVQDNKKDQYGITKKLQVAINAKYEVT